jgi:hypothetical protein
MRRGGLCRGRSPGRRCFLTLARRMQLRLRPGPAGVRLVWRQQRSAPSRPDAALAVAAEWPEPGWARVQVWLEPAEESAVVRAWLSPEPRAPGLQELARARLAPGLRVLRRRGLARVLRRRGLARVLRRRSAPERPGRVGERSALGPLELEQRGQRLARELPRPVEERLAPARERSALEWLARELRG